MLTMFVYALGAAGALLAVGFGLSRVLRRPPIARDPGRSARPVRARTFAGLFGALVLTGFDHRVEAAMVDAMPGWLANARGVAL